MHVIRILFCYFKIPYDTSAHYNTYSTLMHNSGMEPPLGNHDMNLIKKSRDRYYKVINIIGLILKIVEILSNKNDRS